MLQNATLVDIFKRMYVTLPNDARVLRATEKVLDRIYSAARVGLKGDSLALAAGMLPVEYRRLCEIDPMAERAALQGRADSELEHATKLAEASRAGDAKASLAILQHAHGWTARQELDVTTHQGVGIKELLEMREARILNSIAGECEVVPDA